MTTAPNAAAVYYELVGKPISDVEGHKYYGVDRGFAQTGSARWEDTPARDVWKDYCSAAWEELGEWDSFMPNLDVARSFQSRFAACGYRFEIIAIYPCESAQDAATIAGLPGYIGLDVSNTEPNSVLRPEALWSNVDFVNQSDPLTALWALAPKYFRDRVNQWGLLYKYDDAVLFRDAMRALEKLDATHQTPEGVRVLGVQEISE